MYVNYECDILKSNFLRLSHFFLSVVDKLLEFVDGLFKCSLLFVLLF